MKPLLLIISLLFTVQETDTKEIKWTPDSYLTWDAFSRRTGPPELYKAFSYTGISYIIDSNEGQIEVEVTPYFMPEESWVHIDYLNEELLNHEQGHFDIAAVYAKVLELEMMKFEIDVDAFMERDLAKKAEALFYVVFAEMDDCQKRYDAETKHGTEIENQARWDRWLDQKLGRSDGSVHNSPK